MNESKTLTEEVSVCQGKYTVRFDPMSGAFCAFRYGEPWRDLTGDKFTFALFCTVQELRSDLAAAQELIRTREMGMQDTIALHAKQVEALTAERDALAARVAELEKDARRYLILRDDDDTPVWVSELNDRGKNSPLTGPGLDAALDEYAALSREEKS